MNALASLLTVVILAGAIVVAFHFGRQHSAATKALTPEERAALDRAHDAKTDLKRHRKALQKGSRAAQQQLQLLTDPKGRRLQSLGGVTLYERWITTPQGSGSLVGVKAEAADESSVRQRLTVTRMVTLGVFSLAAPKRKGVGNAYVVIEGPSVSGVATIPAANNKSAGPAAFSFAAAINNAARSAAVSESSRPARIAAAQQALTAAQDTTQVDRALAEYSAAAALVPEQFRARFPAQ